LDENKLGAPPTGRAEIQYFSTGDATRLVKLAERLIDVPGIARSVKWEEDGTLSLVRPD
jgi:hypothetical protein